MTAALTPLTQTVSTSFVILWVPMATLVCESLQVNRKLYTGLHPNPQAIAWPDGAAVSGFDQEVIAITYPFCDELDVSQVPLEALDSHDVKNFFRNLVALFSATTS